MSDNEFPEEDFDRSLTSRGKTIRLASAAMVALAMGLGIYLLLESARPSDGLIGFTFLLVLPAAICALVSYVADLHGERERRDYILIPLWVWLGVMGVSALVLREGVICILMLGPLWLPCGMAGSLLTYYIRKRISRGRSYSAALLALPLVAMQVEPLIPLPVASNTVARSIEINAPAERIWPLLRGVPDVRAGEGAWNFTQDIVGVPRPLGARLVGNGIGADRYAQWGRNIHFRERITHWQLHRRIGWQFLFDDVSGWQFTDRHLMPDSAYMQIIDGGYTLVPLGHGRMRLTLDTRYRARTPVNTYAAFWGEVFLGDLENNLLAMIKARAER